MNTTSSLSNNTGESIPRREREKLAHRQDILDAASRVFAHKGFFNATLDEVAHEAEFSKGALYLISRAKRTFSTTLLKKKPLV